MGTPCSSKVFATVLAGARRQRVGRNAFRTVQMLTTATALRSTVAKVLLHCWVVNSFGVGLGVKSIARLTWHLLGAEIAVAGQQEA